MCLYAKSLRNVKDEKTTRLSASGYFRFDARRTYRGCKNGVQTLLTTLKQDPYALETAYVSVITFDSTARQTVPLTDLLNFNLPSFSASGTTALGEALSLTANRIDAEVQKTTAETKGDWRPLIFLMTDGGPTDDWRKGLNEFKAAKKVSLLPVLPVTMPTQGYLRRLQRLFSNWTRQTVLPSKLFQMGVCQCFRR